MSKVESKLKNYLEENQERVDEKKDDVDWRKIKKLVDDRIITPVEVNIDLIKESIKKKDKQELKENIESLEDDMEDISNIKNDVNNMLD